MEQAGTPMPLPGGLLSRGEIGFVRTSSSICIMFNRNGCYKADSAFLSQEHQKCSMQTDFNNVLSEIRERVLGKIFCLGDDVFLG